MALGVVGRREARVGDGGGARRVGVGVALEDRRGDALVLVVARAGLSLSLESLRVNVAIFGWGMEGREGPGVYEITVRDEPAEAA